jgi:predicted nucleotidyltransferase
VTRATGFYLAAGRALSRVFFNAPWVRAVYARRSVAAGEAEFPWSDLDLAIVLREADGEKLEQLRRRYGLARAAFPRLGECIVYRAEEMAEAAAADPYRASLDRRLGRLLGGEEIVFPEASIPPWEAARRVVFWLEAFIPRAVREGNRRNLRKFTLEMANALGVLEGRWEEPLATRRETELRCGRLEGDGIGACFAMAARALARLGLKAPALSAPLALPGMIVTPEPARASWDGGCVVTPEALAALMETQNPGLWRKHGEALARAGFAAPSAEAWRRAARRWLEASRLRGPGFAERGTEAAVERLRLAAEALGVPEPALAAPPVGRYYRERYDRLEEYAAGLRKRASNSDLTV